jgi:hypothetical protein
MLTFNEANAALRYVADTGEFFWKISPARNIPVGSPAGIAKRNSTGGAYRLIRYHDTVYTAAHVAWLLFHGAPLPERRRVRFKDGNTLNLRASILEFAGILPVEHPFSSLSTVSPCLRSPVSR